MQQLRWLSFASCLALISALPASLIDEIKANELGDNKVKRAQDGQENVREAVPFYNQPVAIKRGANLKNENTDERKLNDWEQEQNIYRNRDSFANLQSALYSNSNNDLDDKSIAEYEKGFRYGTNKDKLDEALENAVLKSELYGDPSPISQYRYFGGAEERRRKRRDTKKLRLDRYRDDIELQPEDILTILTLYENERQRAQNPYRLSWQNQDLNLDNDNEENDFDQEDESWLDAPVYPHASSHLGPSYYYEEKPQIFDKSSQWGAPVEEKKKRFMVARKRNDPTRELRYLNGPNKNDFYTLSQLLSAQRGDPNVPLYHRLVL